MVGEKPGRNRLQEGDFSPICVCGRAGAVYARRYPGLFHLAAHPWHQFDRLQRGGDTRDHSRRETWAIIFVIVAVPALRPARPPAMGAGNFSRAIPESNIMGIFPRASRRGYLKRCRGILHVGANDGRERLEYAKYGLPVIWVEPIPEVFERLQCNLRGHPNQIALQALVTDRDGEIVTLHISNNDGQSSSILDLNMHRDIWPDVKFARDISLKSVTLPTLLSGRNLSEYDALVLDTQGSELRILRGAKSLLPSIRYIECEAADFEAYTGCARAEEIKGFLKDFGFSLHRADILATHPAGGKYYDLLFRRSSLFWS